MRCRPVESETTLSFAGLSDLLSADAERVLASLPPPQRRALEVALLLRDDDGPTPDRRALGAAVLGALRVLERERPVVVAVDDLQWLDPSSWTALEFALRRLETERIGFLATVREDTEDSERAGLSRALGDARSRALRLGPLSLGAVYRLLGTRIGFDAPRTTLVRLHEASGGNPFFALELGRELKEGRLAVSPGVPLPLPRNVHNVVHERISRLPRGTREILCDAAALSSPSASVIGAARRNVERVRRELERAERAGLVTLDGDRVGFAHPLLASACYGAASPAERRAVHRRLAAAVRDPEERARHLALAATRRDGRIADALDAAAQRAAARGAPTEAAELSELAAQLTPLRLEEENCARRARAAEHHAIAGALEPARELLRQLLLELPHGERRAEVLLQLASIHPDDRVEMTALCERALEEAGENARLRARIHEQLATAWHLRGHLDNALLHARTGLELAERTGDASLFVGLVSSIAWHETWGRAVTPGLLERGVEVETSLDGSRPFSRSARAMLGMKLTHLGRMDEARDCLEQAYARAVEHGDERSRMDALYYLADLECYAGNFAPAIEHVDAGLELEDQLGIETGALISLRSFLAACVGDVERARHLAQTGVERSRLVGEEHWELINLGVIGFVELSSGNTKEAALSLAPLPPREIARKEPSVSRFWADAVEALVAVGELEQAEAYADRYWQAAAPSVMVGVKGKAMRCRGLVHAAAGDLPAAFAAFEQAVELHVEASQQFERGRTLLVLGTVRRRAKQKRAARDALAEALEIFSRLGTPLWAEKTDAELRRVGLRTAAPDELTETEQRVAELAASGLTNREIASRVFLTPKSVEDVVGRIYRKLGIRSRAELGARMAAPPSGDRA